MKRSTLARTGIVGAACALAGGAAGIAGSSASSSSNATRTPPWPGPRGLLLRGGPLAGAAGRPVHADAVVPNQGGGFDTITMDRGSFSGASGDQLTITEGTKTATYKTVTLTIPSGATIRRDGGQAQLSDLKTGDQVLVAQGPKGTLVLAFDAQHQPPPAHRFFGHRGGPPAPPALPGAPALPSPVRPPGS
jgi:hypothetical protein